MQVSIKGKFYDTSKAKKSWSLVKKSNSQYVRGELYLSSAGTWYMRKPVQDGSTHQEWFLVTVNEILSTYLPYLDEQEVNEIAKFAGIEGE